MNNRERLVGKGETRNILRWGVPATMFRRVTAGLKGWILVMFCLSGLWIGSALADLSDSSPDIGEKKAIELAQQLMVAKTKILNQELLSEHLNPWELDWFSKDQELIVNRYSTPDNACLYEHLIFDTGLMRYKDYVEWYKPIDDKRRAPLENKNYYLVMWGNDIEMDKGKNFSPQVCVAIDAGTGAVLFSFRQ